MSCEKFYQLDTKTVLKLECGPMPNVIVALLNIGGAYVLNAAKFGSRPLLECRVVTLPI